MKSNLIDRFLYGLLALALFLVISINGIGIINIRTYLETRKSVIDTKLDNIQKGVDDLQKKLSPTTQK